MKIKLKLLKPARKSGGDRYEGKTSTTGEILSIYFPQSISRLNKGVPAPEIDITIDVQA